MPAYTNYTQQDYVLICGMFDVMSSLLQQQLKCGKKAQPVCKVRKRLPIVSSHMRKQELYVLTHYKNKTSRLANVILLYTTALLRKLQFL